MLRFQLNFHYVHAFAETEVMSCDVWDTQLEAVREAEYLLTQAWDKPTKISIDPVEVD